MPVNQVAVYRVRQPLREPYHLAFGTFETFDTILTRVQVDGRVGWGECTACPGYSTETPDEAWAFTTAHARTLLGLDPAAASAALLRHVEAAPFAVTGLVTAIEAALGALTPAAEVRFPLIGILSADALDALERSFWRQVEAGLTTVKLKVGFDVERDLVRTRFVQDLVAQAPGVALRIDANQGYTLDQALRFVRGVRPDHVQLFEQPFPIDDWGSQVALAKQSPLPLELDESICTVEDAERAARLQCAQFVKFKLMKLGSAERLHAAIERARALGLRVVLGNGVAGEIGCAHEALIAARAGLDLAGEMNGFLKPRDRLLASAVGFAQGHIVVPAGALAEPDRATLDRLCVAAERWGQAA
jgi:L-alanine-DL-glutamate epimerase-like enolase superfamily enzyme